MYHLWNTYQSLSPRYGMYCDRYLPNVECNDVLCTTYGIHTIVIFQLWNLLRSLSPSHGMYYDGYLPYLECNKSLMYHSWNTYNRYIPHMECTAILISHLWNLTMSYYNDGGR